MQLHSLKDGLLTYKYKNILNISHSALNAKCVTTLANNISLQLILALLCVSSIRSPSMLSCTNDSWMGFLFQPAIPLSYAIVDMRHPIAPLLPYIHLNIMGML